MARTTDFLVTIRRIIKLYDSMLKGVCQQYQLSLIEANIISFLYNNPGKDTAGDIVELRMLAKGNVSQAVEALIRKSLLQRRQDNADRRKIHLSLLPAADPITRDMDTIRQQFHEEVFRGFSTEEIAFFEQVNGRIMENAKNAMERSDTK